MLECVHKLFVWSLPNITAWCATLEAFLGNHKYKLRTRINAKELHIKGYLESIRAGSSEDSVFGGNKDVHASEPGKQGMLDQLRM